MIILIVFTSNNHLQYHIYIIICDPYGSRHLLRRYLTNQSYYKNTSFLKVLESIRNFIYINKYMYIYIEREIDRYDDTYMCSSLSIYVM